jgi:hypothetical protein
VRQRHDVVVGNLNAILLDFLTNDPVLTIAPIRRARGLAEMNAQTLLPETQVGPTPAGEKFGLGHGHPAPGAGAGAVAPDRFGVPS